MERTRSGRAVKRSSKFLEMEDEYDDELMNRSEEEDGDFNIETDNNSDDESIEDEHINFDGGGHRLSGWSRRNRVQGNSQELTWKDGKLVIVGPTVPSVSHSVPGKQRSRQKCISNIEEELTPIIEVKDDPGSRFYAHVQDTLNKPNFVIPRMSDDKSMKQFDLNLPILDLLNDERFKLKIETKNQSLVSKVNKSLETIKDVIGLGVNMEELERYTRVTGYILYNIVSKKKSEAQFQDNQSYKKIQENWATMPDRNKRDWEIKAKQIKKQIDNKRKNEIIEDSSKKEKRRFALKKAEENIDKAKLTDHNLVDLACYLKTVGEGMSKLSVQIASHQGAVGTLGLESTLLDYLMCSIVPLIGIFEGSEKLDRTTTTDTLNKLTFLIPGFN